ncbi:MAG: metallophosphoesterase [Rhodocyclales bacterium]|nr:metallophosphoesterase [Rhodocyclales bacterium]MDB5887731.1 metallophosphoesterase [Rhodocyclales bacterium]
MARTTRAIYFATKECSVTKYALIADIHSNIEALDAVMTHAAAHGVDQHVFLGDLVGYGPDPVAVVERVQQGIAQGDVAVLGNHDKAIALNLANTMNDVAQVSVRWTHAQLAAPQLDFLANLPLLLQEDDMTWVHASAAMPELWAYIYDGEAAARSLRMAGTPWVFCGHVHDPALYFANGVSGFSAIRPPEDVAIPLPAHRNWLAIVGSCGQPRDGQIGARYAIFDRERCALSFFRVPYDYERTAAKIRAAGLPERLARHVEGLA